MLSNIKIIQSTEEMTLNINVAANYQDVIEELKRKVPKLKKFYRDEKIPIRVAGRIFTESQKEFVKSIIREHLDVEVKFESTSEALGLHAIKKTFEAELETSETKYIKTSLRSGQREEYTGSLVILGDVNSGAEVIAGGNIVVVGTLRGRAHAGANGNKKAIISANTVEPTQVRISNMLKEVDETIVKSPIFYIDANSIEVSL